MGTIINMLLTKWILIGEIYNLHGIIHMVIDTVTIAVCWGFSGIRILASKGDVQPNHGSVQRDIPLELIASVAVIIILGQGSVTRKNPCLIISEQVEAIAEHALGRPAKIGSKGHATDISQHCQTPSVGQIQVGP